MGVVEIGFLFFAFLAFVLAVSFFIKKKGDAVANRILGVYLILFSFNIVFNCLYWAGFLSKKEFVHFYFTNNIPWISYGPLFYFYVRRLTKNTPFKLYDVLHFLPLLLIIIGRWPLIVLDAETKFAALIDGSWINYGYMIPGFPVAFIIPQMLFYGVLSLLLLKHHTFSFDRNKKTWLRFFIISFFGYWVSFVSYFILVYLDLITLQNDYFIGGLIVFFIGMVTYFGLVQPQVFDGLSMEKVIPFIKYKKTGLTKSHSLELKDRLISIMEKDKPFLENDLRLGDLAKLLNLSRHHMSQVINEHFQLSFFDFVNQYRIKEAKELLIQGIDDLNITQVAYSVGFNNRVSFYKAFKKFAGTTPSDYIAVHSHHAS